jgi:recombination protein RecT
MRERRPSMSGPDTNLQQSLAEQEGVKENALAPRDRLQALTEPYKREVARALPEGWSAERFIRGLQTVCRQTPTLMESDPVTLIAGFMQLAQLGLTPGVNGYLVPFRNHGRREVQVIIGYKGAAELVRRSGYIEKLTTAVVREGDVFDWELGTTPYIKHRPLEESVEARPASHYYAIAWYKETGVFDFEVMDVSQTDKIRARSKAGESGPWSTDYDEMARKTVLLRLAKRLPMSDEDRRAFDQDGTVKRTIDPSMLDVPDSSERKDVFEVEDAPETEVLEVIDVTTGEVVETVEAEVESPPATAKRQPKEPTSDPVQPLSLELCQTRSKVACADCPTTPCTDPGGRWSASDG